MSSTHLVCSSNSLLKWREFLELWQGASHKKKKLFPLRISTVTHTEPFFPWRGQVPINRIFISRTLGANNFNLAPEATQRPPFCNFGRTTALGANCRPYMPRREHAGNSPLQARCATTPLVIGTLLKLPKARCPYLEALSWAPRSVFTVGYTVSRTQPRKRVFLCLQQITALLSRT